MQNLHDCDPISCRLTVTNLGINYLPDHLDAVTRSDRWKATVQHHELRRSRLRQNIAGRDVRYWDCGIDPIVVGAATS